MNTKPNGQHTMPGSRRRQTNSSALRLAFYALIAAVTLLAVGPATSRAEGPSSFANVIDSVQPKMVKIFGAGGIRGLEAYQSGFLISPNGHVLTVWSHVLDTDFITVTLDDGRKFQGELVGADPRFEIAMLKVDAEDLPHFNLDTSVELDAGDRVLALCNLFKVATGDEPVSVLHGSVAVKTQLTARRGAFETPYDGPVYVLDAMTNNPGAAGGALTNRQGELAGILGKELRNSLNNTWLNYSIPIQELSDSIEQILAGKTRPREPDESTKLPVEPWTLPLAGLRLGPDILPKTPPFVDAVRVGSPAEKAGLRPDDLILFINSRVASSCKSVVDEMSLVDRIDPIHLTVQRGQELLNVVLEPSE